MFLIFKKMFLIKFVRNKKIHYEIKDTRKRQTQRIRHFSIQTLKI